MNGEFQPFKLEITISTLEQAKAFYAIFNHTRNSDLLPSNDIRLLLQQHVGRQVYVSNSQNVIAQGITYEQFYK